MFIVLCFFKRQSKCDNSKQQKTKTKYQIYFKINNIYKDCYSYITNFKLFFTLTQYSERLISKIYDNVLRNHKFLQQLKA